MNGALSPVRGAGLTVTAVRLTVAELLWSSTLHGAPGVFGDDTDDRLGAFLGLGPGDGHDELTRCDFTGCPAFFWADEGALVLYESGAEFEMCPAHAQADDPGALVYPGVGLEARWRDADVTGMCARIRATGSAW